MNRALYWQCLGKLYDVPLIRRTVGIVVAKQTKDAAVVMWQGTVGNFVNIKIGNGIIRTVKNRINSLMKNQSHLLLIK